MGFFDESQKAVQSGVQWNRIRDATADIQHQLRSMKFEIPDDGEKAIVERYEKLYNDMMEKFASISDE